MQSSRVRNAYSVPDVAMFGSTGKFNSARSLPPGERVSLPYFGKAPVTPLAHPELNTSRSGKAYSQSRTRSEREQARRQRSGVDSQRSSRAGSRSWGNSSRLRPLRESSGNLGSARRSSMWQTKRDDFIEHPRFATRSQMNDYRKASMLPHHTFDVDGDGVVSSEDFALAQAFDINKDGVLDDDERHELRKEMVASLVAKYRRLPHSESEESEQLIRKFTKDIDQTVQASDFMQNYNKLHRQTMVNNTTDSTHMFEATQPEVVQQRSRIAGAFKEFDINGDGVIDHSEFTTGVRNLAKLDDDRIQELISIVDKDNDGEIDYLEFAKQCTDPGSGRAKQVLEDVTKRMTSARSDEGESDKVDTFRDRERVRGSGYAARKYSGYKTKTALKKSRDSGYRQFATTQLLNNLKPVLKIY